MTSQEKLKAKLNQRQLGMLDMMPRFPTLDKGSQDRLRKQIDQERKDSPDFDEAFGTSLSSIATSPRMAGKATMMEAFKDVVTHPIRAVKGEIGRAVIKKRNQTPEILVHPHPILSKQAERVGEETSQKELQDIARALGAALRSVDHGDRLGMAAPQIGISKAIFVCQGAFCINPSFTPPKVGDMVKVTEGCYSVGDGKLYTTQRHKYGWAKWTKIDGTEVSYKLKGLDAIVFQHELDHLNGKCCCDTGVEYIPEEKKPG